MVRSTISLFCRATLRHLDNEIGGIRQQLVRAWWFGFGILAVAVALIVLIERSGGVPELLSSYLTEGLFVIGWVAAWFPIDMALYARWPMYRDKRIYRKLMDATVEICAEKYIVDPVTGDIRGLDPDSSAGGWGAAPVATAQPAASAAPRIAAAPVASQPSSGRSSDGPICLPACEAHAIARRDG